MRFQELRRHEVFAIDWVNVDLSSRELTIPEETKTGWRSMPIFPEILDLLVTIPPQSRTGKVVQWSRSQEIVTQLLKRHVETIVSEGNSQSTLSFVGRLSQQGSWLHGAQSFYQQLSQNSRRRFKNSLQNMTFILRPPEGALFAIYFDKVDHDANC